VPVATGVVAEDVCFAAGALLRQMKDDQEPIGGERAEEQALAAAAIEDELASHGAVRALRGIAEIANRELRPILAVAVGEDTIGGIRAVQIDDRSLRCMNGADRRDGDGPIRAVLHLDLDSPHGRSRKSHRLHTRSGALGSPV